MKKECDLLVVDDEPAITGSVARICAAEGMTVDQADCAAAGFAMLERCAYRLIVCDIRMAGVDGFQFLSTVAAMHISTPVVMVTGYATVQNVVRSMFSGAVDFIPKPFTSDELLAVVQRGLRYDQLLKEAIAAAVKSPPGAAPYASCPLEYRRLGHVSWVSMESREAALVGVCDPFVRTVGGVRSVKLMAAGGEIVQGDRCAAIISEDGLSHGVMSPISGRILGVNAKVVSRRSLVEEEPYAKGWLYRVLPSNPEPEFNELVRCRVDSL
ncbi:MAG: response regulator [Elusimicrobia bacterium]|nr:response regulator [Elusimicrobiota bacterium]